MMKSKKKLKIAVAMSGGVDSAVAAKLLKDQGHNVVGIFLHFWHEEPSPLIPGRPAEQGSRGEVNLSTEAPLNGVKMENKCCSAQALLDARRVADKIGIRLYTLNFAKIFKEQVVNNFLAEYSKGQTPNPCVRCNKLVKLGYLIKQAKKMGFDYVATGHYARLRPELPNYQSPFINRRTNKNQAEFNHKLYKAKDKNKDQSYFLYTFNQSELKHLLFPLGSYTKLQVRQMAKKFKLPVAEKPESQEICFISGKSHNEFLKRHLKLRPGSIIILEGARNERPIESCLALSSQDSIASPALRSRITDKKIIGAHQGLPLYTIGQRKGIKIGGIGPFYAAKMDYKTNILYVINNRNHPLICKNELIAKNVNWLSDSMPKLPLKCQAVIRYHHPAAKCVITKVNKPGAIKKTPDDNNFKIRFFKPQRAITSGQSVVFYRGEEVLGGGVIK